MCVQALQIRLRNLSAFLGEFQKKKVEQMRKARAKPASYFGHVGLGRGFGQLDSKGRANPPAKRQRLDDPVAQEADRSVPCLPCSVQYVFEYQEANSSALFQNAPSAIVMLTAYNDAQQGQG